MAQLLSNLPNRALIKFGKHQVGSEAAQPIVWMVADKNHKGYPANSVTLITEKIIDLRAYDASEADDSDEEYYYGNYTYKLSNIHQWLNSSASAGNWYSATHTDDRAPSYKTRPGFLYNFTADERLALLPTTIALQPQYTSGESTENIVAKVFLPSAYEILARHSTNDKSVQFSCFSSGSKSATLTEQAYTNTTSSSKPETISNIWQYMTRTYYRPWLYGIFSSVEAMSDRPDKENWGVRPVVNLAANTKISDTPDSDGCYTFLAQNAPVISGSNSDLGINPYDDGDADTPYSGFSQTYIVNDVDNEAVTVTEYLDNVKVRSYVATLGANNTFAITGTTWLKLANGIHTMKITATDGFDEVTRTYTFTKSVTKLVAQRSTPFDSTTQPKSILATVVKVIPEGAIFKVEACNNGYDASPTWEDITTRVNQGRIYDFTNTAKTAAKWGVNIRVTVDRNGSEGACYITEIGGNFE